MELDRDARREIDRAAQRHAREADRQFVKDVQDVFATPAGRRLLSRFLRDASHGQSVFRPEPIALAHAAGWQDAGNWWIDAIRRCCPQYEAVMRNEEREAARGASQDEDDERFDDDSAGE